MIELWVWLEATGAAQHLKAARWTYPLVNAGHILGIALLVGAVIPMDLRVLGLGRGTADQAQALLRPTALAGLLLAVVTGSLLFVTQASDYAVSPWFWAKIGIVTLATVNAAWFLVRGGPRLLVIGSLILWPAALVLGRMIAYG